MMFNNEDYTSIKLISAICGMSKMKSKDVLEKVGGIVNLTQLSEESRGSYLTPRQCVRLKAAMALNGRLEEISSDLEIITGADSAHKIMRNHVPSFDRVYVLVMFLNRASNVISVETTFLGSVSNSNASPAAIYRRALEVNASSIIVGNTRPSGSLIPSREDRTLNTQLETVGRLIDIKCLDRILLDQTGNYYSFADSGEL